MREFYLETRVNLLQSKKPFLNVIGSLPHLLAKYTVIEIATA